MRIAVTAPLAGLRLDKLIAQAVPGLGRAGAKRLFVEGRVRVAASDAEGERAPRASKGDVASLGQVVVVDVEAEAASAGALPDAEAPLTVLLETDRILILEHGRVTAFGAPDELAHDNPGFREALLMSGLTP